MDELIARLVANVGVDRTAAEKAVGIIFEFLRKEGPADKVQALLERLPGAEALMGAQEGIDASGGGIGGHRRRSMVCVMFPPPRMPVSRWRRVRWSP